MKLNDRMEELLEQLWNITIEQKAACDCRILKDDDAVTELENKELVKISENKIELTEKGEREAKSCVRRHRLAERLLVDVLDMKKDAAHKTGCEFEHLLHKGLEENICTLLGHPDTCPHGRAIPKGACCLDVSRESLTKIIVPLTELVKGEKAEIVYLKTVDRNKLQQLLSIGILPHTDLEVIQKSPSYVLQIGNSQFAIDKELASHIYVRKSKW